MTQRQNYKGVRDRMVEYREVLGHACRERRGGSGHPPLSPAEVWGGGCTAAVVVILAIGKGAKPIRIFPKRTSKRKVESCRVHLGTVYRCHHHMSLLTTRCRSLVLRRLPLLSLQQHKLIAVNCSRSRQATYAGYPVRALTPGWTSRTFTTSIHQATWEVRHLPITMTDTTVS